jgi:hypothetical protein
VGASLTSVVRSGKPAPINHPLINDSLAAKPMTYSIKDNNSPDFSGDLEPQVLEKNA